MRRLVLILLLVAIGGLMVTASAGGLPRELRVVHTIPGADFVLHMLTAAVAAFAVARLVPARPRIQWTALGLLAAFFIVEECTHVFLAYRSAAVHDAVGNVVGVLLGGYAGVRTARPASSRTAPDATSPTASG